MTSDAALQPLRVSVAMCTFNAGRFLSEQLRSIQVQTQTPAEIVICDDGSSDSTLDVLQEFEKTAGFPVRVVRNRQNLGYSRNFAQAVALCSSDLVALSDQDDSWSPHKLERLQTLFANDQSVGGIFSDGDLIDTESRLLPGSLWQSFEFRKQDYRRIVAGKGVQVLMRRNVVTGMALAFRREWGVTLQAMPPHWPHDFWLALMLAEQNALLPCRERLVAYRVHSNQQVGVPITRGEKVRYLRSHGLRGYLQLSQERNQREYRKDAEQFEALLAAVKDAGVAGNFPRSTQAALLPPLSDRWWIPLAEQKALHMRRGAERRQQGRIRRSASALYHWESYRNFAPTGLRSLLRDLLL